MRREPLQITRVLVRLADNNQPPESTLDPRQSQWSLGSRRLHSNQYRLLPTYVICCYSKSVGHVK